MQKLGKMQEQKSQETKSPGPGDGERTQIAHGAINPTHSASTPDLEQTQGRVILM